MWAGIGQGIVGATRGIGAICGIIGACISPRAQANYGVIRTGLISLWLFLLFIIPAMIVNFNIGFTLVQAGWVMMGTVVLSRVWLWIFDLAHTMVMQSNVHETERGKINGWQRSMTQSQMGIISILAVIFSDPLQFRWLAMASVLSVFLSTFGWSIWAYRTKEEPLTVTEGEQLMQYQTPNRLASTTEGERLTSKSEVTQYQTFSVSPEEKN